MNKQQRSSNFFVECRRSLSYISKGYIEDVFIDNFLKKSEEEQIEYEHTRGEFCDHFLFKKEAMALKVRYVKKDEKNLYEIELRIYNKGIKDFKYRSIFVSDCISLKIAFEGLSKKLKGEKIKMIFIK